MRWRRSGVTGVAHVSQYLALFNPVATRWEGTVASGYVTALGFAIYVMGEIAYYRLMDDAVSEWLRTGPLPASPPK